MKQQPFLRIRSSSTGTYICRLANTRLSQNTRLFRCTLLPRNAGRVWLYFTRADRTKYGVNITSCNVMDERTDVCVTKGPVNVS